MTLRGCTAIFVLALSTAALADGNFDRRLRVSDRPDLYVSTGSGSIRIYAGAASEIHVVGHVHAGWGAVGDANARIQRIVDNPPVHQDGNSIHVGDAPDRSIFNNISIDYEITVPFSVALNLHTGSGDIEVDHVGRFLAASSGSGAVRAHGLRGPAELQSGSGDIELEQDAAGDVRAKTGSGSIRVHGLDGGFEAHTGSGDIQAEGRVQGASSLSSGSGSIRLNLTPDSRFDVQASTGSGDIRINFPGAPQQTEDSRHRVSGPVNGGGPPLEAHTGSGDIEIDSGYRQSAAVEQNSIHVVGAVDCATTPAAPTCAAR